MWYILKTWNSIPTKKNKKTMIVSLPFHPSQNLDEQMSNRFRPAVDAAVVLHPSSNRVAKQPG